jgi:transposase
VVHSASVQDRAGAKLVLRSISEQHPNLGLVWVDGGYANTVDATLIGWCDRELGIRLEVVKRNDDVKGFHILPRRWVVERTLGWLTHCRRQCRDYCGLPVQKSCPRACGDVVEGHRSCTRSGRVSDRVTGD